MFNPPNGTAQVLPTPCLRCGGPMALMPAPYLHSDLTLACPYCGQKEALPAEGAAQVRQLRLRLLQIQQSREAAEAPLRTIETIRQHWLLALVPIVLMSGWQFAQALSMPQVPVDTGLMLIAGGALGLGMVFGYLGMMSSFRRLIRPLLQARAPLQPGASARCRTCGGELPFIRAYEVTCGFCNTKNLLNQEVSQNLMGLLEAERNEYQRRASQTWDQGIYHRPMRAFYRWTVAGAVVFVAVGALFLYLFR